jgi:hypothetical protein
LAAQAAEERARIEAETRARNLQAQEPQEFREADYFHELDPRPYVDQLESPVDAGNKTDWFPDASDWASDTWASWEPVFTSARQKASNLALSLFSHLRNNPGFMAYVILALAALVTTLLCIFTRSCPVGRPSDRGTDRPPSPYRHPGKPEQNSTWGSLLLGWSGWTPHYLAAPISLTLALVFCHPWERYPVNLQYLVMLPCTWSGKPYPAYPNLAAWRPPVKPYLGFRARVSEVFGVRIDPPGVKGVVRRFLNVYLYVFALCGLVPRAVPGWLWLGVLFLSLWYGILAGFLTGLRAIIWIGWVALPLGISVGYEASLQGRRQWWAFFSTHWKMILAGGAAWIVLISGKVPPLKVILQGTVGVPLLFSTAKVFYLSGDVLYLGGDVVRDVAGDWVPDW